MAVRVAIQGKRGAARRSAMIVVATVVLCATVLMVAAVAVADRYRMRVDLAAPGGSLLAPRTRATLASLEGGYRLLVAADFSTVAKHEVTRLSDVLDEMVANGKRFDYTLIDVTSAEGMAAFEGAVRGLVEREAVVLRDQSASVELAMGGAEGLAAYMNEVASPALLEIQAAISPGTATLQANRDYFEQTAARVRLTARALSEARVLALQQVKATVGSVLLPRTDLAKGAMVPAFEQAVELLTSVVEQLGVYAKQAGAGTGMGAGPADVLRRALGTKRDQAGVLLDSLRRMERPDVLRVADGLALGQGAVLVAEGGKGIVAINLDGLLPGGVVGEAGTDRGTRIEEAVVGGLLMLTSRARPIVVLVHGEPRAFLQEEAGVLGLARGRLEARGIDFVEWACVPMPERPSLAEIDREGKRPVVYVVMSADSTADSGKRGAQQTGGGQSGIERNQRVGEVVRSLLSRGESVCVGLNPSIVATYGDKDPVASALETMGIGVDSGRPLLREQMVGGSRSMATDFVAIAPVVGMSQEAGAGQLIRAAVAGLPVTLPWPIALRALAGSEARAEIILSIENGRGTWAESQWLSLWQTPRDRRGLMVDMPKYDAGRDSNDSGEVQGWGVVMQSERRTPAGGGRGRQRVVAVGSNSWLIDPVAGRWAMVDGRRASVSVGNFELLDAVVSYLAFQDELISRSASARAASMVIAIDEKRLMQIRLAVVVGFPAVALLCGVVLALTRR